MRIAAIEPFFGGSHQAFLQGWQRASRHQIDLVTLPARKWKWRMRGAAIHVAEMLCDRVNEYDALFASDFLSLADFVALCPAAAAMPKIVYFHENQLTYPCRDERERDYQFGFTNITTCLVADRVFFNSAFHRNEFLEAVGPFLARMPDYRPEGAVEAIARKSDVLHLGVDLRDLLDAPRRMREGPALVLWNHRWEFDKNPEAFFRALYALADQGVDFRLAAVGERYRECPTVFDEARERLGDRIVQWGHVASREAYRELLGRADLIVSTAIHEFFGVAVVEAIAAGCWPILPRRLSYPELLPEDLHARHLYNTDAQLARKLRDAIKNVDALRLMDLRRSVARFDWSERVAAYDDAIEESRGG